MSDFEDYESVHSADDNKPLSDKALFRSSLEEQTRRLSTCISEMQGKNNRVTFVLDSVVAAEIKKMAQFENVSLSEMSRRLLTEYMNES